MFKKKFLSMCITAILYPSRQPQWERDIDDAAYKIYWASMKE